MKHEGTIFKKLLLKVSKQKGTLQYRLVHSMQNKNILCNSKIKEKFI
jgi:hypothetical protein